MAFRHYDPDRIQLAGIPFAAWRLKSISDRTLKSSPKSFAAGAAVAWKCSPSAIRPPGSRLRKDLVAGTVLVLRSQRLLGPWFSQKTLLRPVLVVEDRDEELGPHCCWGGGFLLFWAGVELLDQVCWAAGRAAGPGVPLDLDWCLLECWSCWVALGLPG
ncbi:unnamed protein product [Cuscuta europaea]|uniref:Uncharacterized protein n=1 Tax=Cuscuta europaea TaxID=41803 RepID=A0A9P1EG83_CUSEU|nr:unnamed protein product [Cuscuta europaea]